MAWTAALGVSVGDATKETHYDQLVANAEYLQTLADVEHDFDVSTGDGGHKSITLPSGATINYAAGNAVITHSAGVINVSTGALQVGGVAVTTGSKAALTGSTNNTLTTVTGADAIQGEANLTFDGTDLVVASGGSLGIGGAPARLLHVQGSPTNSWVGLFQNSHASTPRGIWVDLDGKTGDNIYDIFRGDDSGGTVVNIWSDGDLANADGTYGTLSDVKFKQDIDYDLRSYWDDFKGLPYAKWRDRKAVEADPDAPYRIGLVAQDAERIFPSLVPESPEMDGAEVVGSYKWIKSSIIEGPIMAKVVQELQARVEALEIA